MRTVFITGASRGIGAACAELFLSNGYNVVTASRTGEAKTGERMLAMAGDVSDPAFVRSVFQKARAAFETVDVLVNNAAVLVTGKFEDLSLKDWEETIGVNLTGPFLCCQEFFRQASKDPKRRKLIVNVSSLGGIPHTLKFPGMSAYVVSKFGITGLTEALALEGKALGIDVIGIAPGAVDTEMLRKAAPHFKAGAVPLDIARVILDLAKSESSAMFSGAMIPLDTNL